MSRQRLVAAVMNAAEASLVLSGRLLLGGLVLAWSIAKLWHLEEFQLAIRGYEILPSRLVSPVAVVVSSLEFGLGVSLLVGLWVRTTGITLLGLLAVLSSAMLYSLLKGRAIPCGCSHKQSEPISVWTFGRNMSLMVTALAVSLADGYVYSVTDDVAGIAITRADALVAVAVAIAAPLVAVSLSHVVRDGFVASAVSR